MEESSSSSSSRLRGSGPGEARDFAALVEWIDGIVWEADARSFNFTFVSPKAEEIVGYPPERWLEANFWMDRLHPEDREAAARFCRVSTEAKRNHELEYRFQAADGRWIWLRDMVTVVLERDEVVSLRGVMLDVTRQKETELALRDTIERFELVAAGSNGAIRDWNLAKGKVYYSPRWLELRGLCARCQ